MSKKTPTRKSIVGRIPLPDKSKHGNAARPLRNAIEEHGFRFDYNPNLYNNRARSVDKVQLPLVSDDFVVDWHTFSVPRPFPYSSSVGPGGSRGPQWWASASPRDKRAAWEEVTGSGAVSEQELTDPDLQLVRGRVHELLGIVPTQFSVMLTEIRYRRDQARWRMRKRREKVLEEESNDLKRGSVQNKRKLGWWVCSWWRTCLFDTPGAARAIFFSACFHIWIMSFACLVQQYFEIQELTELFPSKKFNPITSRIVGVTGIGLILGATLLGIWGQYCRKLFMLRMYFILFILGVFLFLTQCGADRYYGDETVLSKRLKDQVQAYLKNKGKKVVEDTFLLQVQEKFRCCGYRGASDFWGETQATKLSLPSSCCEQLVRQTRDCHLLNKGLPIPEFVHGKGCSVPLKLFLNHLHLSRQLMAPFMLFGLIVHIFSAINLHRKDLPFLCRCRGNKNKAKDPPNKSYIFVKQTLGELLLQNIEEAITTYENYNLEFELEKVHGTINYVHRKLGECEHLTDFILCIVELLHETEVFQESEFGGVRPDPEVIARVILGLRPKRFVAPYLIEANFEALLQQGRTDPQIRKQLARRDLVIRMNMQEVVEIGSERLSKIGDRLEDILEFPLPRPLAGLRVSEWRRDDDEYQIVRRDHYVMDKEGIRLDPLDPDYLEQDRVLALSERSVEEGSLRQCCAKMFPSINEVNEEEYFHLENGLYEPAIEVLSQIISESQGILRDIHKKARFAHVTFNDPSTTPVRLDEQRNKSFLAKVGNLDMEKVNSFLRRLCALEAIREEKMQHWIYQQEEEAAAALTQPNPQPI